MDEPLGDFHNASPRVVFWVFTRALRALASSRKDGANRVPLLAETLTLYFKYEPTCIGYLVPAMPMLFRICRRGSPAKWIVLLGEQPYGEYLDKTEAIMDAIEAVEDARALGHEAEVCDCDGLRVY